MKKLMFTTIVFLIVLILKVNYISAQTFLFQNLPKEKSQIGLQIMQPSFESDEDLSFLSGIYDFSVNIPLTESLNLVGSIPFITFAFGDQDAESGVGSIFLGLQTCWGFEDKNGSIGTFGIFAPTAGEDIGFFGLFTDYNNFHKYLPDLLTIYGNYAYHAILSEGIKLGVEIGPNIAIPTKGDADTELFIHYGFTAGYQAEYFAIFTELVGLAILTEDADDFSDRFKHSIDFGAIYISNSVEPGLFYKLYLDENLSDVITGVLGIQINVLLN